MRIEIKSLFKDKIIIFLLIFMLMCHFISAQHLKANSKTRREDIKDNFRTYSEWIPMGKLERYMLANIYDTTEDKRYYNNLINTLEYVQRKDSEIAQRLESGEDISLEELITFDIINDIIFPETSTAFYSEESDIPSRVFPKKLKKFQEDVDFEYDLTILGFLPHSHIRPELFDYDAYNTKNIENKIDNYYKGKMNPTKTEYSIYNFIRSTNYGYSDMWSYWMESLALGLLPLVIYQQISEHRKNGTLKNIYLRPVSKYRNFLYIVILFLMLGLTVVYLPKIVVNGYVYITGERYDANTDVLVYKDGLSSFNTSAEDKWRYIDAFRDSMTNFKTGEDGRNLFYDDLISMNLGKFLSYVLTLDILRIVFIVILSVVVGLYVQNRIIGVLGSVSITLITMLSKTDRLNILKTRTNPFTIPNGWRIVIGREYISFYNTFLLLIVSILIVLGLSMIVVRFREIE